METDWEKVLNSRFPGPAEFTRIPEQLARAWELSFSRRGRLSVREARGHWDYLYDIEDLVRLRGNRFHKKKNLVNQFRRRYEHVYSPLGTATVTRAMGMQSDWCEWRDCESSEMLSAENKAIEKILRRWDSLKGITGGCITIEDQIAGYTVAEELTADTLLIHFEKANAEFKGAYQAINQMFLQHAGGQYRFVNREQDLDDEGLRKSKLSYHPVAFVKKYRVTLE